MKMSKTLIAAALGSVLLLAGCGSQAETKSRNLKNRADNFDILRRVVVFNGITDKFLMEIVGFCSILSDNLDSQLEITCEEGNGDAKIHYAGLSHNVSYFVEQLEGEPVSGFHTIVNFRPQSLIPDVDFQGSLEDLPRSQEQKEVREPSTVNTTTETSDAGVSVNQPLPTVAYLCGEKTKVIKKVENKKTKLVRITVPC